MSDQLRELESIDGRLYEIVQYIEGQPTMRDRLAMAALQHWQGVAMQNGLDGLIDPDYDQFSFAALRAYQQADAMLRAREAK
jgi:hypothetical protein